MNNASAAEGAEAVGDVDEVAVVLGDEAEPAGRLQGVAGAIVEVGEDVPLAQVVVADPLGDDGRLAHRAQRGPEVALIGLAPAATIRASAITSGPGDSDRTSAQTRSTSSYRRSAR